MRQASPKRRRKRSPSRTSPLEEDASPIPPKRHRTSFETEDTPFTYAEESSQDGSMPPMDLKDGDNKETVVEVSALAVNDLYSLAQRAYRFALALRKTIRFLGLRMLKSRESRHR